MRSAAVDTMAAGADKAAAAAGDHGMLGYCDGPPPDALRRR